MFGRVLIVECGELSKKRGRSLCRAQVNREEKMSSRNPGCRGSWSFEATRRRSAGQPEGSSNWGKSYTPVVTNFMPKWIETLVPGQVLSDACLHNLRFGVFRQRA